MASVQHPSLEQRCSIMIYAFWEGRMPEYLKLCMETWRFPYVLLNYDNLNKYTDLPIDKLKRFSIMQVSDVVRVHVLRDQGGYWLDTDTIMVGNELPKTTFVGDNESRINSIGYLYAKEPHMPIFEEWAKYQDLIVNGTEVSDWWALMANSFSDPYLKAHKDIEIGNIYDYWLETTNEEDRHRKYLQYYFRINYMPDELPPMIMLHNSWTPKWYKNLSREEVLAQNCTLSNILRHLFDFRRTFLSDDI